MRGVIYTPQKGKIMEIKDVCKWVHALHNNDVMKTAYGNFPIPHTGYEDVGYLVYICDGICSSAFRDEMPVSVFTEIRDGKFYLQYTNVEVPSNDIYIVPCDALSFMRRTRCQSYYYPVMSDGSSASYRFKRNNFKVAYYR